MDMSQAGQHKLTCKTCSQDHEIEITQQKVFFEENHKDIF